MCLSAGPIWEPKAPSRRPLIGWPGLGTPNPENQLLVCVLQYGLERGVGPTRGNPSKSAAAAGDVPWPLRMGMASKDGDRAVSTVTVRKEAAHSCSGGSLLRCCHAAGMRALASQMPGWASLGPPDRTNLSSTL